MTHDGGPAYPTRNPEQRYLSGGGLEVVSGTYEPGMSLRDYFAGEALDGMIYGPNTPRDPDIMPLDEEAKRIAKMSYMVADAMLKERSK